MTVPRASREKVLYNVKLGAKPKRDVPGSMEVIAKRNKSWLVGERWQENKQVRKQAARATKAGIAWPILIPSHNSRNPTNSSSLSEEFKSRRFRARRRYGLDKHSWRSNLSPTAWHEIPESSVEGKSPHLVQLAALIGASRLKCVCLRHGSPFDQFL